MIAVAVVLCVFIAALLGAAAADLGWQYARRVVIRHALQRHLRAQRRARLAYDRAMVRACATRQGVRS